VLRLKFEQQSMQPATIVFVAAQYACTAGLQAPARLVKSRLCPGHVRLVHTLHVFGKECTAPTAADCQPAF